MPKPLPVQISPKTIRLSSFRMFQRDSFPDDLLAQVPWGYQIDSPLWLLSSPIAWSQSGCRLTASLDTKAGEHPLLADQ